MSNPPDTTPNEPTPTPVGIRWWPAAVIVLFGFGTIVYAHVRWPDEQTWRHAVTMIATMAIAFFLLLWWLFFSRGDLTARQLTGVGVLSFVGLFLVLFEKDELSGSMLPSFRFRWSQSAEERAVDYFSGAKSDGVARPRSAEDQPGDEGEVVEPGLVVGPDDWPEFRGPDRDGITSSPMRTDWEANPPGELWRHPIGVGWSSFAVVDGLAFTQEQRGREEMVVCYDMRTGKQVWAHGDEVRFSESQGGDGPRATPTIHDGRLYALGATGVLNCLDPLSGSVYWTTNVLEDAGTKNLIWGMSGSPLVDDEIVVVNPGRNGGQGRYGVAAYDRLTGEPVWTAGEAQASYCAPRFETLGGVRQVLVFDAAGLTGHDPKYGTELWHFPWKTFSDINVAQPIRIDDEHVFVGSGYSHGSALVEITRTGTDWTATKVYENTRGLRLKFQSAVRKGDYVYGLDDGILACHEIATGKRVWKDRDGTYGFGQLLLVGEHLLVTVEKTGEVALVKATPEAFEEVSRFKALGVEGHQGIVWNHPVLWNGLLLVRNAKEVACYDLRP